jgi:hypothetical protein
MNAAGCQVGVSTESWESKATATLISAVPAIGNGL